MADHLSDSARKALSLSDAERIAFLRQPLMLGYLRAIEILDTLEDLLSYPRVHRMPNMLIYGRTNNGKTMIVRHFREGHPASDDPDAEHASIPVLMVNAPPTPSEADFLDEIIRAVYAPGKFGSSVGQKRNEVLALLEDLGVRMVIIDEIQHVLAGGPASQRAFMHSLKLMGNKLCIPIVAVGTDEAFNAFRYDGQMANRFEAFDLPLWKMGTEYLRLLVGLERELPLKQPSYLHHDILAVKILALSEGTIGEIATVAGRAAIFAIKTGAEHINEALLDKIRYVPPSRRRTT